MKSLNNQERRDDLESALDFLNAEISPLEGQELLKLIQKFAMDQGPRKHDLSTLNSFEALHRLSGPLICRHTPKAVAERKGFLIALQDHLRSRIESIMKASSARVAQTLFDEKGRRKILFEPQARSFVEFFEAEGEPEDPLTTEKRYLDERLVNLIRDLDLDPGRLKRCPRCGKIFYQFSLKERKFCSDRCGGAVHQAKYRKAHLKK